jgi:23S rRNA (adenine2503-C2)-methyltransferase
MGEGGPRDFTALTAAQRRAVLAAAGEPAYRAAQLEQWLFPRAAGRFDEMSDLPAALRARLAEDWYIPRPEVVDAAAAADGTTKFLFRAYDGLSFEAVYMPGPEYDAACLSCQVGCGFGCRICATGSLGFQRNLSAYEIISQLAIMRQRAPGRIRNVLFMGQGEPFANYKALREATPAFRAYFGIGARRVTVSTVGLPERIRAWAAEGSATKLAVSLNSAVQTTRDELMPGAAGWPLAALADACGYYTRRAKRQLTLEYVLCAGVNDDRRHARALVAFAAAFPAQVNVIPFNAWPGAPYQAPEEERLGAFVADVARGPRTVTVRRSRGLAGFGACGTLACRVGPAEE